MATGTVETDKSLGLSLLFGFLALAAAAYTFVAPSQFSTAVGFAAAVTLAVVTVGVLHVYD